ncbi:hypothetical protein GCM10011297_09820 [Bacterioplanes sanyensis]|uniref:TorF family putative porin n=1 Tax=Bacterioplanes sanyensis TaxID=1249553 RepID=UPI00167885E6|nr:TorF family putative porin [Bacterioplanes sanyensis]GGY38667.1 hypothetical protein GCM10011297_09820 [Bacterioplanes sanyensis]
MRTLLTSVLLLAALGAQAQQRYNLALVSDYLFRGLTKTDHEPALQGGMDVRRGDAYAGIWLSNIDAPEQAEGIPVQMDAYFGYNHRFGGFNLDTSVVTYNYLVDSLADETEFRLATNPAKGWELSVARGIKQKTWYPEIRYEHYLQHRLYLDVMAGVWLQDDADDKGFNLRAELARDFPEFHSIDLFVALDFISDQTPFGMDNDEDDSDIQVVFGIRKNF